MSLFIITRMRESDPEFPDEFSRLQNPSFFSCPERMVWVFEGTLIFDNYQTMGEDGTLMTRDEELYRFIENLPRTHVPQKPPEDVHILVHDRYTVKNMKERRCLPWLEQYASPKDSLDKEGDQLYKMISKLISRTSLNQSSPDLVQSILCSLFYRPFLQTAQNNFLQHFAERSERNVDFQRDILPVDGPFPTSMKAPVQELLQVYNRFFPVWKNTPLHQTPADYPELLRQVQAIAPPCTP